MKRLTIVLPLVLAAVPAFSPRGWVADKLGAVVFDATGYTVSIGDFDVDVLTLTPTVRLRDVDVDGDEIPGLVEGANLTLAIDLKALATGDLVVGEVTVSEANVFVHRDADGRSTWSSAPVDPPAEEEEDGGPFEIPSLEQLSIENVTVRVEDAVGDRRATLAVAAAGSTTDPERPLTADVDGEVDGTDAALALALPSLAAGQTLDAGVALRLDASLGEIRATLDGTAGNPLAGQDVALDATFDAPDLAAIERILGRELPALAPIDVDASVRTEGDVVILEPFSLSADAVAATGEARLERGTSPPTFEATFDVPTIDVDALLAALGTGATGEEPANADVDTDATTPDADVVATGTRVASVDLPAGDLPFTVEDLFGTLHGTLVLDIGRIVGEDVPLDALSARLGIGADEATLSLRGDVEDDDAELDVALTPDATGSGLAVVLDAALGDAVRAKADGRIGDLTTADDIALAASVDVDDLAAVERVLGRELPALAPLTFGVEIRSEGEEIVIERVAVTADGIVAEGTGRFDPSAEPPTVQAALRVPTIDVDALTTTLDLGADEAAALADETEEAANDAANATPPDATPVPPGLELPFATARLFDTVRGEITLDVEEIVSAALPLDAFDARVELGADTATFTLDADVGGDAAGTTAADVSLALTPLEARPDTGLGLDLDATLGGASVRVAGSVGDIAALREVDLDATLDVDDLAAVEALAGRELPGLAPLDFEGGVLSEGDELVVRRFDLSSPGVVAEGDFRADPGTVPPTLYANVIVPRLDTDALLEAFGVDAPLNETVDDALDEEETEVVAGTRLLSDEPLPLAPLFATAQGAIALRIDEIVGGSYLVDALDARLELDPSRTALTLEEVRFARGSIEGRVVLEPLETPAGAAADVVPVAADVELALAGIDVTNVVRKAELPDEAGGRLGANVKLWSEGVSVAELAGALDGGVLALMSGGTVDAVFVELAGIDLFQSLGDVLVPGEEEVPIRCAYVDLQAENGLLGLDRFVLDTADTVFLADGTVDLGTEALALTLDPHPKDASLLAASTAVELGGTLAAPEIGVGDTLPARAAAAAVLALVATPAAALLPLIEIGGGEDTPFCTSLGGALD